MDNQFLFIFLSIFVFIPAILLCIKNDKVLNIIGFFGIPTAFTIVAILNLNSNFITWKYYIGRFLSSLFFLVFVVFLATLVAYINIPGFIVKIKLSRYSDMELENAISIDNWMELKYILRELIIRGKDLEPYKNVISEIASSDNKMIKNHAEQCIKIFFVRGNGSDTFYN
ncbi:hypothetical protein [Candidatus Albibeggiatoa sp. nov. BB20]|uniref:hypothetical protein n=1 Tax=Candidatus Albibeggiatoa sp. nov. BB20 TaxID=3162723 RepID=UPI003365B0F6